MQASRVPVNQIKQREQVNPDDVDEVPIEAADLDWSVPLGGEAAFPGHDQEPEKNAETDDHVQRVQASHDEVEREEQLRVAGVGVLTRMPGDRLLVETERGAGDVMLHELFTVLDAFYAEEDHPQEHGEDEARDQQG